jgi:hypothetical protein
MYKDVQGCTSQRFCLAPKKKSIIFINFKDKILVDLYIPVHPCTSLYMFFFPCTYNQKMYKEIKSTSKSLANHSVLSFTPKEYC